MLLASSPNNVFNVEFPTKASIKLVNAFLNLRFELFECFHALQKLSADLLLRSLR